MKLLASVCHPTQKGRICFSMEDFAGFNVSHVYVSMSICIVVVSISVPLFLNGLSRSQTG